VVCPAPIGRSTGIDGFVFTPQGRFGKQVENLAVVDNVHPFGIQTHEVRTVLAALAAFAGLHAIKIRVRAVDAFAKRDTGLGNRNAAGAANREKILALPVVFAVFEAFVILDKAENPAAHKNVRVFVMVSLDLLQALIHPVDAVSAVNHV